MTSKEIIEQIDKELVDRNPLDWIRKQIEDGTINWPLDKVLDWLKQQHKT